GVRTTVSTRWSSSVCSLEPRSDGVHAGIVPWAMHADFTWVNGVRLAWGYCHVRTQLDPHETVGRIKFPHAQHPTILYPEDPIPLPTGRHRERLHIRGERLHLPSTTSHRSEGLASAGGAGS